MAQYARPDSDVTKGNWDDPNGNDNDTLYDDIDEETPSDSDYIESPDDPSSETCEVGLSDVTDPESSSSHTIRVRYQAPESGGGQPATIDFIIALMEGATQRASWTEQPDPPTTWATASYTLTTGEADSIGDYANLRLRFTANKTGGARTTRIEVSWAEFEVPDAVSAIVKIMDETEGLNDAEARRAWAVRLVASTLGLSEAAVRKMSLVKLFAETVGIVETFVKSLAAGPTYYAKVGSFNVDTSKEVSETQSVSGLGFQPKIVMFFWGGSTATSDTVAGGTYNMGFGAAISSSGRFSLVMTSVDAAATSDTGTAAFNTDVIRAYTDGSTLDGIMDFSSMDSDGFTLVVDDQFSNAYRISYLALGGADLTNVYIGNVQSPASTGNWDITSVGFQPDVLLIASGSRLSAAEYGTGGYFSFGWATSDSAEGALLGEATDAMETSTTIGYGYNAECSNVRFSTIREEFVSFLSNGFRLNNLEATAQRYYHFVCLKGGQYLIGDLTTRTDGNDIEEDVGFEPVAVLFASANRALSTQDTTTDHARLSIGAGTATDNRACAAISDEDNLADTETAYANYDSAVYAHVIDDAVEALMDIKSIDSDGFTCVMDDVETSGCWVSFLAIGQVAAEAIVKLMAETLGLSETELRRSWAVRLIAETVGLSETLIRRMWSIRLKAETVGITDSLLRRLWSTRQTAETLSLSETIGNVHTRLMAETVGITEAFLRVAGFVKVMTIETVSIAETMVRVAGFVKVMATETVGLAETAIKRLRAVRLMTETIGLSDSAVRRAWAVRLIASTVGLEEAFVKRMWSIRQIAEAVGISEASVLHKRLVKIITEILGLVESFVKALSLYLGIEEIELDSYITLSVDLESAITKTVEKSSEITKTWEADSYIQ